MPKTKKSGFLKQYRRKRSQILTFSGLVVVVGIVGFVLAHAASGVVSERTFTSAILNGMNPGSAPAQCSNWTNYYNGNWQYDNHGNTPASIQSCMKFAAAYETWAINKGVWNVAVGLPIGSSINTKYLGTKEDSGPKKWQEFSKNIFNNNLGGIARTEALNRLNAVLYGLGNGAAGYGSDTFANQAAAITRVNTTLWQGGLDGSYSITSFSSAATKRSASTNVFSLLVQTGGIHQYTCGDAAYVGKWILTGFGRDAKGNIIGIFDGQPVTPAFWAQQFAHCNNTTPPPPTPTPTPMPPPVTGGRQTFTLSIAKTGTGSGTVTGVGINCGSDCSQVFPANTVVTLSAKADTGSKFAGWNGYGLCSGGNMALSCHLTMIRTGSVTAVFNRK